METRAHYVAVGVFVLVLVFLAFASVLWLAGTQFSTEYTRYEIYFKSVTGLTKGSAVQYNGIPVGQVADIEIDPENVEQIRVTVEIKSSVVIKENAAADVETNILSGVSYILITRGTQDANPLVAQQGQRYPVIHSRRSTLASLSAAGPQLLEQIGKILDHVDELLNDHNRKDFVDILDNVRTISAAVADGSKDVPALTANAKDAFAALKILLTNVDQSYSTPDGLKDRLSVALGDFAQLVKSLGETNHQVQGVVQDLRPGFRTFSQRTLTGIDGLVEETRHFVSGLSRLGSEIEKDPSRVIFGDRREGYHPK